MRLAPGKWLRRAVLGALLVLFSLASFGPGGSAWAAAGPWIDHEQSRLRLIAAGGPTASPAPDSSADGETGGALNLGLQFELEPGWKIYWRSPGEAGYPPVVDWSASENLTGVRINWPVPHRFSLFGFETFGYKDAVVLPIDARAERPDEPVRIRAAITYLACKEICIPREAVLTLDLPAATATSVVAGGAAGGVAGGATSVVTGMAERFLIDSYRSRVPGDGSAVGMSLARTVLTGPMATPVLQVTVRSDIAFKAPDLLVEAPPGFLFGKPKTTLADGGKTVVLRLAALTIPEDSVIEGKRLTLTVTDGNRGMEQEVVARFARPANSDGADRTSLVVILGLALLGGMILNLMPCVLPVLSIKLLSVVKHGGRARGRVRASFLASAAGIVTSFLVLAGAAVALKSLGMTVGWGIQFQQPLFLTAMAVVISLFACNLFGFFEILLPRWAQGLAGLGQGPVTAEGAAEPSLAGHFVTGAFATLLATPCSAPFLGTAVGFALSRGAVEITLIFAVLGLGLALPYLAIAAFPALATRLPRPGPWMVVLRRVLGLALAVTALWLLSVLAKQVGFAPAVAVGGLLAALGAVLWLGHARRGGRRAGRLPAPAVAGVLALAAFVLPAMLPAPDANAVAQQDDALAEDAAAGDATAGGGPWRALDLGLIPALVAEGKVVFVDVTADWCLTCQVNKKLVLERGEVQARFGSGEVVTMRGDWTLPSEEISRYLEGFGRYGIPFDAVYGPGLPDGLALPEILTTGTVIEALERAVGERAVGERAVGERAVGERTDGG